MDVHMYFSDKIGKQRVWTKLETMCLIESRTQHSCCLFAFVIDACTRFMNFWVWLKQVLGGFNRYLMYAFESYDAVSKRN